MGKEPSVTPTPMAIDNDWDGKCHLELNKVAKIVGETLSIPQSYKQVWFHLNHSDMLSNLAPTRKLLSTYYDRTN